MVAAAMLGCVVDLFEPVDVERDHGDERVVPLHADNRLVQVLDIGPAVGEPG